MLLPQSRSEDINVVILSQLKQESRQLFRKILSMLSMSPYESFETGFHQELF